MPDWLKSLLCRHDWQRDRCAPPPVCIRYMCAKCGGARGPAPFGGKVVYQKAAPAAVIDE